MIGTLSLQWQGDTFNHPAPEKCYLKASVDYEGRVGTFNLDCKSPKFGFTGTCTLKSPVEKRRGFPGDN